jgi:hypothetical protein
VSARGIYAYVGGNPLSRVDEFGLKDETPAPGYPVPTVPFGPGTPENKAIGGALDQMAHNFADNTRALGDRISDALYDLAHKDQAVAKERTKECEEECNKLNDDVQKAKKKVGQLGACWPGMTKAELLTIRQAWLELATARSKRDQKCWDGGDDGHQQAQADAWAHVGICTMLLSK